MFHDCINSGYICLLPDGPVINDKKGGDRCSLELLTQWPITPTFCTKCLFHQPNASSYKVQCNMQVKRI